MYTLNQLADGRVELCVMKPTAVAVFYSHAFATVVADRLNEDLRGPFLPGLGAATEMALAEAMPDLADVDTPRIVVPESEIGNENAVVIEQDAEAYAAAFRKIADGRSLKEVADELGVTTNKLRGRYGDWMRMRKNSGPKVAPRVAPSPGTEIKVPAVATAPEKPVAIMADPTKPAWWRALDAHLNALGYCDGWTKQFDLDLVEGLAAGKPPMLIADELGKEIGQVKGRFIALLPEAVTIEGQGRLLQVLRARAEAA